MNRRLPNRVHLHRLDQIFAHSTTPIFFITICTHRRRPPLRYPRAATIVSDALRRAEPRYHWRVGRYVVMPDHLHFFCAPAVEQARGLSSFVGYWKRASAARIRRLCLPGFRWQAEFFGHLLRGHESYAQEWEYVRANPVRGGLVESPEDWPSQGEVSALEW